MSWYEYVFEDHWDSADRSYEDRDWVGTPSRSQFHSRTRRHKMGDMADDIADLATMYEDRFFEDDEPSDYHLAMFNKGTWITADGRHIKLREMELSHLRNTIRYIKNGGSAYGLADKWLPKLEAELQRREDNATPVPT